MIEVKTHVLCVLYGTELYGSERGALQALIALSESDIKVSVAGSGRKPNGGQTGEAVSKLGLPLYLLPFGSHFKPSWLINDRKYRKSIFKLIIRCSIAFRNVLRETQPSHIIIGGTSPLPFIFFPLLFSRAKVIYRMGDAPILSSKLHFPLWKWLVRKADTIVAISDYMQSLVKKHSQSPTSNDKVHVIRNIAPNRIGNIDQNLVDRLRHQKREFQLVYVGQLTKKKGVDLIVEALLELDNPNLGCWIIGNFMGNKSFDKKIKHYIQEWSSKTTIELLGYLDDPRPYYRAADWHIAPSTYQEPLGNVVQEAQLQETPSIITKSGGLPELIEHKKTGWIMNYPTKKCMVETINHLMTPPPWSGNTKAAIQTKNKGSGEAEFNLAWRRVITGE